MLNSKRERQPADAAPGTARSWGGFTGFLRFRSPNSLAGGRAARHGTYAPVGHGIGGLGVDGGGDLLGKILKRARRLFPERQILVRAEGRVSYVTLGHRTQIAMATGGLAVVAAVA